MGRMSLYAAGSPQELRYVGRMPLYAAGSPQGRTAPPSPLCQQAMQVSVPRVWRVHLAVVRELW